jgi:hypothetical protein
MKAKDQLLVVVFLARQILMSCMSRSQLFMTTLTGQSCQALVAQTLPCWFNFVQLVLLFVLVTPRAATNGRSRCRLGPILGGTIGIDYCWGRRHRARYRLCIIKCIASASTFIILLQNSTYQNLNSCWNIFIFKTLNSWFICMYLWILASPRILQRDPVWHLYFYNGGVTQTVLLTILMDSTWWAFWNMEKVNSASNSFGL